MYEEHKKWRCPYCDGLNDWQDDVCQICGDGKRPEAEAGFSKKPPEQEERSSEKAPEPEPRRGDSGSRATITADPGSSAPAAPAKKKKPFPLVAILIIALAALGGRMLANSFVGSLRAGTEPTAKPLLINTPKLTIRPDAAASPASAGAAAPAVTPLPAETATGAVSHHADWYGNVYWGSEKGPFGTVTSNADGTATVRILDSVPEASHYWIFSYCLGPNPDADRLIQYNFVQPNRVFPTQSDIIHSRQEIATISVIPGTYTQVVVRADEVFCELEPFYCPEVTGALPLSIEEANLCVFESHADRSDFIRSVGALNGHPDRDKKVKSVKGLPRRTTYSFTSAEDLNRLMESVLAGDREVCAELIFHLNMGTSQDYRKWYQGQEKKAKVTSFLTGPGLYEIGPSFRVNMNYDNDSFGVQYNNSAFPGFYSVAQEFGGFPAGNYALSFYIDGIRFYTKNFSLKGAAGTAAAGRSTSSESTGAFPLKNGSRGQEVKTLQQALMALDSDFKGPADGVFGKKTEEAVRRQQDAAGFAGNGVVDYEQYLTFTQAAGVAG